MLVQYCLLFIRRDQLRVRIIRKLMLVCAFNWAVHQMMIEASELRTAQVLFKLFAES